MKTAIQQFQLRDCFKNQESAQSTLQSIKACGISGMELCGFLLAKLPPAIRLLCKMAGMSVPASGKLDWQSVITQSGLSVPSVHQDLNSILARADEVAEQAKSFGAKYVTVTGMRKFDYSDRAAVGKLCQELNRAGELLKNRGVTLLYHNHNCEFVTASRHKPFDVITAETDSDSVGFELDAYWATEAGVDVCRLIDSLGKRLRLLHICDRGCNVKGSTSSIVSSHPMEVGCGNMNIAEILKAAAPFVEYAVLEQTSHFESDAVNSMKVSAQNLRRIIEENGL